jgi:hypothetical protein
MKGSEMKSTEDTTLILNCLTFISDSKLRAILTDILTEVDKIARVGAQRSTVYLTMSTLEGILTHVIELNAANAAKYYPKTSKTGIPRKLESLHFIDKIKIAEQLGFIEKELYETFQKMRRLRNYLHPYAELRTPDDRIDLGISQISLGLLNHVLENLKKYRFIKGNLWTVLAGEPIYESLSDKIEFRRGGPLHSFLYTKAFTGRELAVSFNLNISGDGLLNFIFNYESDSTFSMLRLDARDSNQSGILECRHYHEWKYVTKFPLSLSTITPNKVEIVCRTTNFDLKVNDSIVPITGQYGKFDLSKPIGFFNEVTSLSIDSLGISTI